MKEGSLGMSSGLVYTHARSTSEEELIAIAEVIKKYGGVYVTHMRNERHGLIESIEESLEIARKTDVKLHISHLKAVGEKNWGLMDMALDMISHAREGGMDVTFDVYPYTNVGSVLYTLLPFWVTDGGKKMMIARLKDPILRDRIVNEMKESDVDYSKIEIASSSLNKTLSRRKISEIAFSQEKSIEDAVIDILIASEGRIIISMDVLSDENIEKALIHPAAIVSTNGSGYDDAHGKTGEVVHPRSFGTFPRILSKYVLGRRILRWEEAISKMTSIPAKKFGIEKRGMIKEGYYADILVFDRDEIGDMATIENPYQYSKGIDFVLINGQIALQEGSCTGNRSGEIIRS
jgi:N-acyl-D-amino-acid deacylase